MYVVINKIPSGISNILFFEQDKPQKVKLFRFLEDAQEWADMKMREWAKSLRWSMLYCNDFSTIQSAWNVEKKKAVFEKHNVKYTIVEQEKMFNKIVFHEDSLESFTEKDNFYYDLFCAANDIYSLQVIECELIDVLA